MDTTFVFLTIISFAFEQTTKSTTAAAPLFQAKEVTKPLFLYPQTKSGHWIYANLTQLQCPPVKPIPPLSTYNVSTFLYSIQWGHGDLPTASGYLCTALIYSIECIETFFGHQQIRKSITLGKPSASECRKLLFEDDQTTLVQPYFPEPHCNWLETTTNEKTFHLLHSHIVKIDTYKMGFVDSMFINGLCLQETCNTVYQTSLWLTKEKLISKCSDFSQSTGLVYMKDTIPIYIRYTNIDLISAQDTCLITYCGRKGLRLSNGLFLETEALNFAFSECPINTEIAAEPIQDEILSININLDLMMSRESCINSIQKIQLTGKLSYLDLHHLTPKYQMTFPAYRINNGKLETQLATWIELIDLEFSEPNLLGVNVNNEKVYMVGKTPSGDNSTYSIFNGVHVKINDLSQQPIIPEIEILKNEYSRSLTHRHELTYIQHPNPRVAKSLEQSFLLEHSSSLNTVNLNKHFNKLWNNWWGKAVLIFGFLIGGSLAIKLIKLLRSLLRYLISQVAITNYHEIPRRSSSSSGKSASKGAKAKKPWRKLKRNKSREVIEMSEDSKLAAIDW